MPNSFPQLGTTTYWAEDAQPMRFEPLRVPRFPYRGWMPRVHARFQCLTGRLCSLLDAVNKTSGRTTLKLPPFGMPSIVAALRELKPLGPIPL